MEIPFFEYSEQNSGSLCMPFEAINEAFRTARHRVRLLQPFLAPHLEHHLHEVDKLGLALTETTAILAKQFGLNHQQIYYLLPKLDLSLTEIWGYCPAQFRHKACEV
jgi:hypothetical protein